MRRGQDAHGAGDEHADDEQQQADYVEQQQHEAEAEQVEALSPGDPCAAAQGREGLLFLPSTSTQP